MLSWTDVDELVRRYPGPFRVAVYVSTAYWALVLLASVLDSTVVPTFDEVGHLAEGCYQTDALIIFVQCAGFVGSSAVASWLSLPWLLVVSPAFVFFNPLLLALWLPALPLLVLMRVGRCWRHAA